MKRIEFDVPGVPVPQGSMKVFRHRYSGKTIMTTANDKLYAWRDRIRQVALDKWNGGFPSSEPFHVSLTFYFPKPKTVTRQSMTVKPDLDKLIRAVFDALTGVCFVDDSQVISVAAVKVYSDIPRCAIHVSESVPC